MRKSVLAVAFTLLVASLVSLTGSPAVTAPGLVSGIPYSGTETGDLATTPAAYAEGQTIELYANFDANIGLNDVTFYEESPAGSGDYVVAGTDEANTYGNAYYRTYVVHGARKLFAQVAEGPHLGEVTEVYTLSPQAEPTCAEDGILSTEPVTFLAGQTVKIGANFPTPQAFKQVTYFKKVGTSSVSIGTDESNDKGNAYLNYQIDAAQEIFAKSSDNHCTAATTLTPSVIKPENFPQTGALSTSPTTFYDGRSVTVTANFPSGTFGVTLFKETSTPGEWASVGQKTSNSSGDATFSAYQVNGTQKLFALTSTGNRTEVDTLTPRPPNDVTGGPAQLGKNVVYVTTDNAGTPKTKGVDYEGKAVLATDGVPTETYDLETIAVRGNTTAGYPKKPYKLKFVDKQKPFGMKSDKTWILLANYNDWTFVRSKIAWELGLNLSGLRWTPDSRFAELFVNGKYLGSYQLAQSIKIDNNRVNVSKTTGQVIENDPHWKEDGVPGFIGKSGMNYSWKDPDEFKTLEGGGEDPEGLTNDKIAKMKTKIQNFETVLYGADGKKNWSTIHYATLLPKDDWTTYLDMDSALDYYLSREFTKDNDADFYRSNFFYTNNVDPASPDKFFMGPIWDFDRSAGAKPAGDTSVTLPTGWWVRGDGSPTHDTNKIHWFTRITKDPRFLAALKTRWQATKSFYATIGAPSGVGPGVTAAVKALGGGDDYALGLQVAANDRKIWASAGGRYVPKTSSYPSELTWVSKWYSDRYKWMDTELAKATPPIP
jgi:hypothetical protein